MLTSYLYNNSSWVANEYPNQNISKTDLHNPLSRAQTASPLVFPISGNGSPIHPASQGKNHGVIFDSFHSLRLYI